MSREKINPRTGNNSLTVGLASVAGVGFALMAIALAIGVINGESANEDTFRLMFTGGAILFVVGVAAWASVKRPWKNFDDINVPRYHGHHHDDDHHKSDDHQGDAQDGHAA